LLEWDEVQILLTLEQFSEWSQGPKKVADIFKKQKNVLQLNRERSVQGTCTFVIIQKHVVSSLHLSALLPSERNFCTRSSIMFPTGLALLQVANIQSAWKRIVEPLSRSNHVSALQPLHMNAHLKVYEKRKANTSTIPSRHMQHAGVISACVTSSYPSSLAFEHIKYDQ
jgi:hypothetical protein